MSRGPAAAGAAGAAFWVLACVLWFDAGAPLRPGWLSWVPPLVPALAALAFGGWWLYRRSDLFSCGGSLRTLGFVVGLAVLFRLPLAWQAAAGYTTADGSLSGIVAVHIRDGIDHLVFVPNVSYSGSLKSHIAAALSLGIETVRAFALASVLFYALFVAAVYRLGWQAGGPGAALGAGLYSAFSPTFVTQYSLSNDGNYVEVLALGTWALLLAARWLDEPRGRPTLALLIGLVLGVGFWSHILAVIHASAVAVALLLAGGLRALPSAARAAWGFCLGYLPGLLWNAGHDWDSFRYLVPSHHWEASRYLSPEATAAAEQAPRLLDRAIGTLADHGPILFGYDAGYPPALDAVVRALAWLGLSSAVVAAGQSLWRMKGRRFDVIGVLLLFACVNLLVVLVALPHIPGNPRYLLFLAAPAAVFLARALAQGGGRWLLIVLIAFGALGSLGQALTKQREDRRWRGFVAALEREGVRWCYSDYYLATRISFFSEERVVCSAKLGPTTTEYFLEYRERVERAPEAALVAVNTTSAEKMQRRLEALGVKHERLDLMKPVLLRLSRKVDPRELFPGR
jgi:hypothetical protein